MLNDAEFNESIEVEIEEVDMENLGLCDYNSKSKAHGH